MDFVCLFACFYKESRVSWLSPEQIFSGARRVNKYSVPGTRPGAFPTWFHVIFTASRRIFFFFFSKNVVIEAFSSGIASSCQI